MDMGAQSNFSELPRLTGICLVTWALLMVSGHARADFVLGVDFAGVGEYDLLVVDEGPLDQGRGVGFIQYCYEGGALDTCMNAHSKGFVGSATEPVMILDVTNFSYVGGPVVIGLTDTDFANANPKGRAEIVGVIAGGDGIEFEFIADNDNREFEGAQSIGDTRFQSPSSFSETIVGDLVDPFGSLSMFATIDEGIGDALLVYTSFIATYSFSTGDPPDPPQPPNPEPDDRLIDVATLDDVDNSGTVDLAVLNVELMDGDQLNAELSIWDAGSGSKLVSANLDNDWRSLALETVQGNSGTLLAILQSRDNGDLRVHFRDAEDNLKVVGNVQYFDNTWTPIDILAVRDAGGPGISGIGVLAENAAGQQAIEVHKVGNGVLINTVQYFNDIWKSWAAIDLGEFNGNGYSEMSVLATNDAGKHAVETRDLLSGKQISRHFFLGPTNTVIGLADSEDVDSNDRPEIIVLGNKEATNSTANTAQAKDVKTGALISKSGTFGPDWTGFGIRSIDDVDGNSSPDYVVAALNGVTNVTGVQVRDVASGALTTKMGFLGPRYTPQDVEVIDDVSGNGIQEVVVAGVRPDNLEGRIQLRDALDGNSLLVIDID
jgi:hypothetical protein